MNIESSVPAIEIRGLRRKFGGFEALHGLDLTVPVGSCYGFFGRNGAGKTTTIKCLLHLLSPDAGSISVLGLRLPKDELAIKRRLAYVPDTVAFYPWMTVGETIAYARSFRDSWREDTEADLLSKFQLDRRHPVSGLSKGQRTQLGLICAIAADPELLVLDEPTSGLDPIVRREFIETVIGAYLEVNPGRRTVFVSTHLISEFEGLIDRFTILEQGRAVLTADTEEARTKYRRVRGQFATDPPNDVIPGGLSQKRLPRELEVVANGQFDRVVAELKKRGATSITTEGLSLEEIFVAASRSQNPSPTLTTP